MRANTESANMYGAHRAEIRLVGETIAVETIRQSDWAQRLLRRMSVLGDDQRMRHSYDM